MRFGRAVNQQIHHGDTENTEVQLAVSCDFVDSLFREEGQSTKPHETNKMRIIFNVITLLGIRIL